MKQYKGEITLIKNSRGCYIIDTVKGCAVCQKEKPHGCYGDCYAKKISARYGYDFSNPVKRDFVRDNVQIYFNGFTDINHESKVISTIKNIDMPFVRIGEMGDPSQDWGHTINVCEVISRSGKPIVIITKHWAVVPDNLLKKLSVLNICVNTSISSLDSEEEIKHRFTQFNRLKPYCKSVLRIVSCNFNLSNSTGYELSKIQDNLFGLSPAIDTIFRPSKNNPLVINGVINVEKVKFLGSTGLASVHNSKTYFGPCNTCPDMCGLNI